MRPIKVLIVDDSRLLRAFLADIVAGQNDMIVHGVAGNGREALELIRTKGEPDIVSLDIDMPVMSGIEFLKIFKQDYHHIPVLMLSAFTETGAQETFKALESGAWDFVTKPSRVGVDDNLDTDDIIERLRSFGTAKILLEGAQVPEPADKQKATSGPDIKGHNISLVAIGCSTGGPAALTKILPKLPAHFPVPVLIVQHMPGGFTKQFAERLNSKCEVGVVEVDRTMQAQPGTVYIAKGDSQMTVKKQANKLVLFCDELAPPVNNHKPSVDVLLDSVVEATGGSTIGVIMTGMGRDGADGMLKLRNKGAYTICQDEGTSVVYGMNKRAKMIGAIVNELPLNEIIPKVLEWT